MTTISQIKKQVIELILTGEYYYVGVRYESKDRQLGDICGCSKDNPDREDTRDFPDYEDEEYHDLPDLGGTSAWEIYNEDDLSITPDYDDHDDQKDIVSSLDWSNFNAIEENVHCYIVAGTEEDTDWETCDRKEIVICDAEVIMIIK